MMMRRSSLVLLVLLVVAATPAFASHSWGGYHWARTSNPFTLKLYDNLDPVWESYLTQAVSDWNKSTVLDYAVQWQQPLSSQRRCASTTGVVEICNETYGQNGWLGLAGISISGSHITKGYTKLNDTYFAMAQYNTPAYRQFVTCQEIGHDFGLDHQDEVFNNANLGSCMDYTNDPDGGAGGGSPSDPANTSPNQHDYDQTQSIYSHLDSTSTIASRIGMIGSQSMRPPTMEEILSDVDDDLGTPVRLDGHGRPNVYVRPIAMNSNGELEVEVTFIYWANLPGQSENRNGGE